MISGVQYERYYLWVDPRKIPRGAKRLPAHLEAKLRENARDQWNHALHAATTRDGKPVTPEMRQKGICHLRRRGPTARRRVLVVLDAPPPGQKPRVYWHATVVFKRPDAVTARR